MKESTVTAEEKAAISMTEPPQAEPLTDEQIRKEVYKGMTLNERMIQIRRDISVSYIQKTDFGSSGAGSDYLIVTYDQVVAACRQALNDAEVMVWTDAVPGSYQKIEKKLTVIEFEITFEFGKHSKLIRAYGEGHDGGDKGANKAATYALKTALLKTFLIETGENEEALPLIQDTDSVSTISASELEKLQVLIKETNTDIKKFITYLNDTWHLNLTGLVDITTNRLPLVVSKLNSKLAKSRGE